MWPLHQHPLDPDERSAGLDGVRSRADAERDVRLGKRELLEKASRQGVVVVLAGV